MSFTELREKLSDERCGLYFLAGLDSLSPDGDQKVLTVHASQGAFYGDQEKYIRSVALDVDPDLEVRVKFHSASDLHEPDSLESFARNFQHQQIVSDPTGAFFRAPELLRLASNLRGELGGKIDRILWKAEYSALLIQVAPSATEEGLTGEPVAKAGLQEKIDFLVNKYATADLRRTIKLVRTVATPPTGSFVPVDALSARTQAPERKPTGLAARVAGIAALIGIGIFSSAATAAAANVDKGVMATSGFSALSGLTSLGENSLGVRNHYRAIGGLKLYFRDSVAFMSPGTRPDGNFLLPKTKDKSSEPIRVAYG